jgi:riboflavin kinase/FMN adenylyltransferase
LKIFHSKIKAPQKKTILTLGTFDGVHIGHQKNSGKSYRQYCKRQIRKSCSYFLPHPRMVLQEQSEIKLLNTIEEKFIYWK